MASNFPTSLDSFTNPLSGDKLDSPSHSTQHADANDAIEGLETKIGIGASPAGSAIAGYAFVHSSGGTTAWSQVGYEGITSGTATSGQVLTAGTATGTTIWSTPTASGLVQIVPSSVVVGSGSGSSDANGKVTFTSVSSVSLNDVFSSTYSNYLILVKSTCTSATQLSLRMRVSGTDLTSSSYMYGGAYVQFTGSSAVGGENSSTTTSAGFNILDVDGNPGYARVQMFDPFATEQTGLIYDQVFNSGGSRNTGYWESFSGLTTVTTSYTGFTLLPATGNVSGTISVFAYR